MSVAFTSSGNVTTSSAFTTLTISSVAITGTDRAVVVGFINRESSGVIRSVSSISRGTDTYAEIATATGTVGTNHVRGSLWGSTNEPQTAAADLAVTLNASVSFWGFGYMAFEGVDQTTRFGTAGIADGRTAGTGTVSITDGAVGDMIVDILAVRGNVGAVTVGAGQTQRESFTATGAKEVEGYMSTKPGASSTTVEYTWTDSHDFGYVAVNVFASGGSASGKSSTVRHSTATILLVR